MNDSKNTYTRSTVKITQRHRNIDQEVIEITVDKLRLILHTHIRELDKQSIWKGDLGVFVTLLLAVITSDFRAVWGVEANVWRSLFIVGAIVYAVKLVVSLFKYLRAKSLDDVILAIKSGGSSE